MNQKVSGLLHSQIVLVIVISRLVVLLSREGGKQERGTGGRGHCGADVLFFSLQASKAAVWASLQVRGKASSLLTSSTAKHPSCPVCLTWRSDRLAGGHLYMFTVCSDWQPEGWRAQTQSADSPHFCCTCHRMSHCAFAHDFMGPLARAHVCICAFMCVQHALDALISRKLRSAEANARAFVMLLLLSHSHSSDTDLLHKCYPLHHVIARAFSFFII